MVRAGSLSATNTGSLWVCPVHNTQHAAVPGRPAGITGGGPVGTRGSFCSLTGCIGRSVCAAAHERLCYHWWPAMQQPDLSKQQAATWLFTQLIHLQLQTMDALLPRCSFAWGLDALCIQVRHVCCEVTGLGLLLLCMYSWCLPWVSGADSCKSWCSAVIGVCW